MSSFAEPMEDSLALELVGAGGGRTRNPRFRRTDQVLLSFKLLRLLVDQWLTKSVTKSNQWF